MKTARIKIYVSFIFCLTISRIFAQESTASSGSNATGVGGSASYTVGQIVYATSSGINGSVSQGVQQPFEISVVTAIDEAKDINLFFTAFPNPTSGSIKLVIENYEIENLNYQLYDMNGKALETNRIINKETIIDMESFVSATYFIKISENNKEVKTFKIIKN